MKIIISLGKDVSDYITDNTSTFNDIKSKPIVPAFATRAIGILQHPKFKCELFVLDPFSLESDSTSFRDLLVEIIKQKIAGRIKTVVVLDPNSRISSSNSEAIQKNVVFVKSLTELDAYWTPKAPVIASFDDFFDDDVDSPVAPIVVAAPVPVPMPAPVMEPKEKPLSNADIFRFIENSDENEEEDDLGSLLADATKSARVNLDFGVNPQTEVNTPKAEDTPNMADLFGVQEDVPVHTESLTNPFNMEAEPISLPKEPAQIMPTEKPIDFASLFSQPEPAPVPAPVPVPAPQPFNDREAPFSPFEQPAVHAAPELLPIFAPTPAPMSAPAPSFPSPFPAPTPDGGGVQNVFDSPAPAPAGFGAPMDLGSGLHGATQANLPRPVMEEPEEYKSSFISRIFSHASGALPSIPQDKLPTAMHKPFVITFWAPKGGTGKTTTALNTTAYISSVTNLKTILVDLDAFGDTNLSMDLEKKITQNNVAQGFPTIDDFIYGIPTIRTFEDVENYVLEESDTNLYIMLTSQNSTTPQRPPIDQYQRALDVLMNHFQIIAFDCGPDINEYTKFALQSSDAIILVADQGYPTLVHMSEIVVEFSSPESGIGASKLIFVLNKYRRNVGADVEKIQTWFQRAVSSMFTVPAADNEYLRSLNKGKLIIGSGDAKLVAPYRKIVIDIFDRIKARQDSGNQR